MFDIRRPAAAGLAAAVLVLAIDQASKAAILGWIMNPPTVIPLTDFFNLVLGFNTGVTFGIGSAIDGGAFLLSGLALAVVVGLAWQIWRTRSGGEAAALGAIVGGALGNVIDRLRQGAVTDFLDLYLGEWHWPTFNLADVAILTGVGCLIFLPTRRLEAQQAGTSPT